MLRWLNSSSTDASLLHYFHTYQWVYTTCQRRPSFTCSHVIMSPLIKPIFQNKSMLFEHHIFIYGRFLLIYFPSLCSCRTAPRLKDEVKPNRRARGSSGCGTPSTTSILPHLAWMRFLHPFGHTHNTWFKIPVSSGLWITSTWPLNVPVHALLRNVLTTTCSAAPPPISCRSTQRVDWCLDAVRAGFGEEMFHHLVWIKTRTLISFSMMSMI